MRKVVINRKTSLYDKLVYLCVFLACMAPRYVTTFKIRVGIGISPFTILVVLMWALMVRKIRLYKKIESYLFALWLAFALFSVWRAKYMGGWAYYVDYLLTAVLFLQILYKGDQNRIYDVAVRAVLLGLLIHLLIGLYEVSSHRYLFEVGDFSRRYYGTTAVSIFYNPNDYVTFVVTVMPFAVHMLSCYKNAFLKAVCLFIIVASVYLTIVSESRGGFLALVMLGMAMVYLYYRKSSKNKVVTFIGLIAAIGLCLVITPIRNHISAILSINMIDVNVTDVARVNLIRNGLYFLKETHGFGVGAGNLYYWLTERSIYNIGNLGLIHNWYVEILVTFGVLFFILYMIFHVKIIVTLIKNYNKKDIFWNLNNTFLVSFLGFSIVSISSSSNVYSEWIWMYLALISTFCLFAHKRKPA